MKHLACILLAVLLFSCKKEVVEKPEHLLTEQEMSELLYDMALLQAIKTNNPSAFLGANANAQHFIYKKYRLDSLSFVQNHNYYVANLELYEKMQQQVAERLRIAKEKADPKNNPVTPPAATAVQDSLEKAALNKRSRL